MPMVFRRFPEGRIGIESNQKSEMDSKPQIRHND